jgi:hypothetical protein
MADRAPPPYDVPPRPIATVRSIEEFCDAIAAYCAAHGITRAQLDQRAGLADGHSSALLSPKAAKKFGPVSFRWVLAALDLELTLQRRADAPPITNGQNHAHVDAHGRKPARQDWRRTYGSAWGRRMTGLRMLVTTREQRREIARRAAIARWQRSTKPQNLP